MDKTAVTTSIYDDAINIAADLSHVDLFIKEAFSQDGYLMIEQICNIFELHVKCAAAALTGKDFIEAKEHLNKLDDTLASAKDFLALVEKANMEQH